MLVQHSCSRCWHVFSLVHVSIPRFATLPPKTLLLILIVRAAAGYGTIIQEGGAPIKYKHNSGGKDVEVGSKPREVRA